MTALPSPEALSATTADILESAAYFSSAPADTRDAWPGDAIEAALTFRGPASGMLRLRSTPAFAAELAANMLGLELGDPEAEAQARAALGELLNIVTGALVAQWFGVDHVCQLGIPQVGPVGATVRAATVGLTLSVEDAHRLDVDLFVEPRLAGQ